MAKDKKSPRAKKDKKGTLIRLVILVLILVVR